jgi:hypothetical protein
MGNLAVIEIPTPKAADRLLHIDNVPIVVEENALFIEAETLRDKLLAEGKEVRIKISSVEEHATAMKLRQVLKRYHEYVEDTTEPVKVEFNNGKQKVMDAIHKLIDNTVALDKDLARSTGAYEVWQAEQLRLEQERREREAELERQAKQRAVDLQVLQKEIELAQQSADEANGRGQLETKNEIDAGIRRMVNALKNAATAALIANPIQEATSIKQCVALAIQHEQARIAAAAAKAEGDKKAARDILKAAAKLEAPEVEEIYVPQVQAAPVVVRQPASYHAPGSHVGQIWRVKRIDIGGGKEKTVGIVDPGRVCREHPELCSPNESKLNDLCRRIKTKPDIPGVIFELDVRTKGVR